MTNKEAIDILINYFKPPIIRNDGKSTAHLLALEAIEVAIEALKADPKDIFYDGYAYCLLDFGKDTVLCKDCKHWDGETHGCEKHPSVEPWWETDSCNYGERKESEE